MLLTFSARYLDKAKAELPVKRSRKEELAAKMAIEDSILEAVNLKKQGFFLVVFGLGVYLVILLRRRSRKGVAGRKR